jgi:hypothetical protein
MSFFFGKESIKQLVNFFSNNNKRNETSQFITEYIFQDYEIRHRHSSGNLYLYIFNYNIFRSFVHFLGCLGTANEALVETSTSRNNCRRELCVN